LQVEEGMDNFYNVDQNVLLLYWIDVQNFHEEKSSLVRGHCIFDCSNFRLFLPPTAKTTKHEALSCITSSPQNQPPNMRTKKPCGGVCRLFHHICCVSA
jgi:hypothetical protein